MGGLHQEAFKGADRVWAGTMHVYPLKTESINTCNGGVWRSLATPMDPCLRAFPSFFSSLPPSLSFFPPSSLPFFSLQREQLEEVGHAEGKALAALENLRFLPDTTEIKPKQHTYTA